MGQAALAYESVAYIKADGFECFEPTAAAVSELPEDELICRRADRLVREAARLAVGITYESDNTPSQSRYGSLLEAAQAAARGEIEARAYLEAAARTDAIERSIKAGHITEADVETDADGRILQHGQYLDDVHRNALVYGSDDPEMHGRFIVDLRNGKRAEHHHRQGRLEDHYFFEASLVADLPAAQLQAAGFFTDTMSMIYRLWSAENGTLKMISAFVAGTTEPAGPRHDYDMIEAIGETIGLDYGGMSATEILDHAALIPKSMLPNGIIDLVSVADDVKGTFFGQNKPRQDYRAYLQQCRQREAELEPTVRRIVTDMIAAAPYLQTPDEATAKLHDLSEKHLLQRSLTDRQIDPRVFGSVAAEYIHKARFWMERGDMERAELAMGSAAKTAVSSSCPTGKNAREAAALESSDASGGSDAQSEKAGGKVKMTCPFCGDKNQYNDPCAPKLECTKCRACVLNGKVVNHGDGGRAARRREAAVRSKARRTAGKVLPKLAIAG